MRLIAVIVLPASAISEVTPSAEVVCFDKARLPPRGAFNALGDSGPKFTVACWLRTNGVNTNDF